MGRLTSYGTQFSKIVLDSFDGIAYLADIDTYELVYINKQLKELLNIADESYVSQKCFEVLQGRNAPCEFCTNARLTADKPLVWDRFYHSIKRHFELKDSVIEFEGHRLRLEFGVDISHIKCLMDEMRQKISVEQMLVKCASTLCNIDDMDFAITQILESVVEVFKADRAYLFEYKEANQELKASYCYAKPEVKPFKDILSVAVKKELQEWLSGFKEKDKVYYQVLDRDLNRDAELYKALKDRSIDTMLVLPVYVDNRFEGLIGVDNVTYNTDQLQVLSSVAMFILDHLRKRKLIERLDYLSNIDELTGVYNRNKYISVLGEIKKSGESVGIIYIDLNGLKRVNDESGHEQGDLLLRNTTAFLTRYFGRSIYRIGGDEFVVLLRALPEQTFLGLVQEFKCDLKQHGAACDLSYGEEYCRGGDADWGIKRADELMLARKRRYYEQKALAFSAAEGQDMQ